MIFKSTFFSAAVAFGALLGFPATTGAKAATLAESPALDVKVLANVFFNPTGLWARAGQTFRIEASGVADISDQNGGYKIDPNGTILETPPVNSGAFDFFKRNARPFGADPVAGTEKLFSPFGVPGHLDGAPYGALVAGFSRNPDPSYFDDFPNGLDSRGFSFVGRTGTVRAPQGGGYLFLAVNDVNNPDDNSGSFSAHVSPVPEPASLTLLVIGLFTLVQLKRRGVV
ncbi:hypothetical protein [Azohydromonas caseinilytica]|uniref:PEP-CTERM protein-sorting domain-containing protein n=1 Tax=Azohydromonas caseinilytica TaxID=2728836 RepID=A0A848FBJ2_9BURK|nr:hypothetical protein [Azohydromonas caseinilytica]NML16884.1 hypothetical protein [Azohydromonas caseinilytica]